MNYDNQAALVKKFHIGTIPVVVLADAKGNLIKKTEPKYLDAKALLKVMDEVSSRPKS